MREPLRQTLRTDIGTPFEISDSGNFIGQGAKGLLDGMDLLRAGSILKRK